MTAMAISVSHKTARIFAFVAAFIMVTSAKILKDFKGKGKSSSGMVISDRRERNRFPPPIRFPSASIKGYLCFNILLSRSQHTLVTEKTPPASIIKPNAKKVSAENLSIPVSPKPSSTLEEEVENLRAQNKVLSDTLKDIQSKASEEYQKHYDLVWFARNRCRFPNSAARKRIELQYADELKKLQDPNAADFHHGVHAGLLAASKMVAEHAAIVDAVQEGNPTEVAREHQKRVLETKESFPDHSTDEHPSHE